MNIGTYCSSTAVHTPHFSAWAAVDQLSDRSSTGTIDFNDRPHPSMSTPSLNQSEIKKIIKELRSLNQKMEVLNTEMLKLNKEMLNLNNNMQQVNYVLLFAAVSSFDDIIKQLKEFCRSLLPLVIFSTNNTFIH